VTFSGQHQIASIVPRREVGRYERIVPSLRFDSDCGPVPIAAIGMAVFARIKPLKAKNTLLLALAIELHVRFGHDKQGFLGHGPRAQTGGSQRC
jgi:hypothetical protein